MISNTPASISLAIRISSSCDEDQVYSRFNTILKCSDKYLKANKKHGFRDKKKLFG
jgi:hypothetical protein